MSPWGWVGLAFLAGLVLGVALHRWRRRRSLDRFGPELLPTDVPHVIDLLRRAHRGWAVCFLAGEADPICSIGDPRPPQSVIDRAQSLARLAMADGREHVVREGHATVAVGDGELGASLVLGFTDVTQDEIALAAADLRRVVAEVSVERRRELGVREDPRRVPEWVVTGSESLEALAYALSEAVRALSGRSTAVVARVPPGPMPTVVAVSQGTDRRFIGRTVPPDSAAGRALLGDVPVIGRDTYELLGRSPADRRRHTEPGIAFPLRSGREGVGALIVFGPHNTLDAELRERVLWLAVDAGPRIAVAAQIRAAETRATTDHLTGLPNRRALERAVSDFAGEACALLYADIDHFKRINDRFGHLAGDEALKLVARVLKQTLREDDVPARIGGEEFALWLPGTPLADARDVAERVRAAVAAAPLSIGGEEVRLTLSLGIAAMPEIVARAANLYAAADAALYQAKVRGRNRVEVAAR